MLVPNYKASTRKLRAKMVAKSCIKNRLNQSAVARQVGVSHQAINKQFHRKPVQDALQKFLDSPKLKRTLKKVAEQGLSARIKNKIAHKTRHKYWHDLMIAQGHLKINGNGHGNTLVLVQYGYRAEPPKETNARS